VLAVPDKFVIERKSNCCTEVKVFLRGNRKYVNSVSGFKKICEVPEILVPQKKGVNCWPLQVFRLVSKAMRAFRRD
jgi:hypothetical protein